MRGSVGRGAAASLVLMSVTAAWAPPARGQEPDPEAPVAEPPVAEPPVAEAPVAEPPVAEPPVAAVTRDVERPPISPGTVTLDRFDTRSRFGIQVGFDKIDQNRLSNGFGTRYEPYAFFRIPNSLVGIYGQLPLSHAFNFNGSDATGVGNMDVGAYFLSYDDAKLMLRVGLALPTASDDTDAALANVLGGYERLTDLLLVVPNYTTVRLSASTLHELAEGFLRADVGFDIALDKPSGGPRSFLRANVALGAHLPAIDVALELANLGVVDSDYSGEISDRFVHTAALGLRTRGYDQFHFATVVPLDDAVRGEIWIFSFGYQRVVD
jgi:hypothetical protein